MARPKKHKPRTTQGFRLDPAMPKTLERVAAELTAIDPTGREWTKTDLVEAGLTLVLRRWRSGVPPWSDADAVPAANAA